MENRTITDEHESKLEYINFEPFGESVENDMTTAATATVRKHL